jgi:hypothetical protein
VRRTKSEFFDPDLQQNRDFVADSRLARAS